MTNLGKVSLQDLEGALVILGRATDTSLALLRAARSQVGAREFVEVEAAALVVASRRVEYAAGVALTIHEVIQDESRSGTLKRPGRVWRSAKPQREVSFAAFVALNALTMDLEAMNSALQQAIDGDQSNLIAWAKDSGMNPDPIVAIWA